MEGNQKAGELLNRKKTLGAHLKDWSTLFALILIWGALAIVSPHFLTVNNISNLFMQYANIMMVALGLTFILITGMIDLSVGSVEALAGAVAAILSMNYGVPVVLAILIALLVGGLCGVVTGSLVAFFGFPPFIASLAMQSIARGVALIFTQGSAILIAGDGFRMLGRGKVLGEIPFPAVLYVGLFLIAALVLKRTRFGVNIYSVGSNEEAANLSGVNVKLTKILAFVISGMAAAFGGIILASRLASGNASIGETDVMDGVASVVIGGTSMRGGVGNMRGTFIGVLIIGSIRNGLNLLGVDSYWQMVLIGLIIIASILIDLFSKGELRRR